MKAYFGKDKICVYIDQFAASNLFDEPPDELWTEIAALIDEKFAAGKLICPVPPEHFLESSNKTHGRAVKVDAKFYELGYGLAFLPEAMISANYIIALLRGTLIDQKLFCTQLKYETTLAKETAFESFKNHHQDLNAKITEATAGSNELRDVLREKRFSRSVMEPLYQAAKWMQVRSFLERLEELVTNGHIISRGVNFQTGPVIHWVDLVLQLLLWSHKVTLPECVTLIKMIEKNGFDNIPPLDIRASLTANLVIEHKKETINDQIDIMRLSSGLPVSDLVFTDKQRKYELLQTGLGQKYNAELFSGTPADLILFRDRLTLV